MTPAPDPAPRPAPAEAEAKDVLLLLADYLQARKKTGMAAADRQAWALLKLFELSPSRLRLLAQPQPASSPALAPAEALEKENRRLREALEWYGRAYNWTVREREPFARYQSSDATRDCGKRARTALADAEAAGGDR